MDLPYEHMNGFSDGLHGGNAAGVVLPHHDVALTDEQRQAAAAEIGFSETVFVSSIAANGDGRAVVALRYFTPAGEVELCGHATVACLGHLSDQGLLPSGAVCGDLNTLAGQVAFRVEPGTSGRPSRAFMEQLAPTIETPLPAEECSDVSAALGAALNSSWNPRVASTGLRDLLVAVASREVLAAMRPDMPAITALSKRLGTVGVHAFCFDGGGSAGSPMPVRNFAPLYGIDEESATGTSNCALACALRASGHAEGLREMHFAQGDGMGEPSRIVVTLPDSTSGRPWVGGACRRVASHRLDHRKLSSSRL